MRGSISGLALKCGEEVLRVEVHSVVGDRHSGFLSGLLRVSESRGNLRELVICGGGILIIPCGTIESIHGIGIFSLILENEPKIVHRLSVCRAGV